MSDTCVYGFVEWSIIYNSHVILVQKPTIIYADNSACIAQMNSSYTKSDITKHITPKLFYPHKL
jgi:hypothetical protein